MVNWMQDAMSYLQPGFRTGQADDAAGNRNPLAWLLANRGGRSGVETGGGEELDDLADALTTRQLGTDTPPTGVGDGAGGGPDAALSPGGAAVGQPSGQWGSWLEDPANRSFMMSMGLQLMTGGWGNIGQQLAAGLGAGLSAANVQERRDLGEVVDERGTRTTAGRGRGRGRTRLTDTSASSEERVRNTRRRSQLAEAEEFINSNPTPEAWNVANQPGGLLHVAFGGPQDYNQRNELLHLAQDERTRVPRTLPGDYRTLTPQELIALGSSRDPGDLQAFQEAMVRRGRRPPQGQEWYVDSADGSVKLRNITGARVPGAGRGTSGTAFSQAAQGGVDAARLTINNVRDWLTGSIGANDPTGISGMAQRAFGQTTGVGDYAAIMGSMKDGVMAYVHSRSGAQVAVREFEHYLTTRMPVPGDSEGRIRYKLADLELALLLIARRRGENIPQAQLHEIYNLSRRHVNLSPVTEEEFNRLLPALEAERGVRPGAGGTGQQPPPAVAPPPPRTEVPPPPGPNQTPLPGQQAVGTRENPHVVRTPEEGARVPRGQFFRTPDGRLRQRE